MIGPEYFLTSLVQVLFEINDITAQNPCEAFLTRWAI
jgi:hypothetical protein